MKILVTGGAGFIGSTVADKYLELGHRVWIIDDESTGRRSLVPRNAVYRKISVANANAVRKLFARERFDVINHHAAQIDVRKSVQDPTWDATVNILGTLNMLRAAVATNVKKFIFSSSGGTVYGECRRPATESDPENPLSPYGVAKLAGEKYIKTFSALHRLPFVIFRYANVFGPRQDPHGEAGVVAIFSRLLLRKERALIYGTGKQTRDFVYVGDVAAANAIALRTAKNDVFNIGTGVETSVSELYALMAKLAGAPGHPLHKPARPGELSRSVLDPTKAKKILGWTPQTSLESGILATMKYFLEESV